VIRLPPELLAAVEGELQRMDPRHLVRLCAELSARYRGERLEGARAIVNDEQALAYAALLLPATFTQVSGSLRTLPRRAPEGWAPRSVLDLGSGPGTALWAVADIWPTSTSRLRSSGSRAWPTSVAGWRRGPPPAPSRAPRGECNRCRLACRQEGSISSSSRTSSARWPSRSARPSSRCLRACEGALVVVEPGTPAGFVVVETARRQAIALGGRVLAPCPHDGPCRWPRPVDRSRQPTGATSRSAPSGRASSGASREASLPWEDAKFSHVVLARWPSAAPPWARVLRHPWHAKGRVELALCSREGLVSRTITRSSGDAAWKLARRLEWGSAVEAMADIGRARGESTDS